MGIKARGLGGVEWVFDYPLPPEIKLQFENNTLTVIEMTGEDARPEQSASRDEWVNYLARIHDVDAADTKGESKAQLIEWADELDREAGRAT